MALLTLKDIGKIYVSKENITVGIRGVNLSFNSGEFVAITGKSGSGKSTLLNVISGMDSYEEGELYIEGQSTSHYLQPDWEVYREKYISFIFQDYNIIESFTVLQNVELALMHIEDKKARRARAMELIRRVGLISHINHKGSKLSGGQKQRTVIARALAKDSPIILADEPTGNLDSNTSKEIIELLREVSKDKLLIVVTHNFEQLQAYATRHVRIFDGAVESDHVICDTAIEKETPSEKQHTQANKKKEIKKHLKDGITLGKTVFTSKPRLSVFLCLLMIIGLLGIFASTSLFSDAGGLFRPHYMFNRIDGRLVLVKPSGEVFSSEEAEQICTEYGADNYLQFDLLLDGGVYNEFTIPVGNNQTEYIYAQMDCTYGRDFGENIIGRYPEKENEVFLYLPISYRPHLGKNDISVDEILLGRMSLKLVGIKYYYDNNLTPQCLFTDEGFRTATALHYLFNSSAYSMTLRVGADGAYGTQSFDIKNCTPSFDMDANKIYIDSKDYRSSISGSAQYSTILDFSAHYTKYNEYGPQSYVFQKQFTDEDFTDTKPSVNLFDVYDTSDGIIISDELLCQIAESILSDSYKQLSLFFENDREAHNAAERLQDAGYIAVTSDATYEPSAGDVLINTIAYAMMAFLWVVSILFLAFFINLCSSRALEAFKGDMAIMRSMGIQVKVIRIGMYVRMLISLIPACALLALTSVLIFTTPAFNAYFTYLYPWQYLLILVGMLALTLRITHKQIKRLFGESVKKSLRGGKGV